MTRVARGRGQGADARCGTVGSTSDNGLFQRCIQWRGSSVTSTVIFKDAAVATAGSVCNEGGC